MYTAIVLTPESRRELLDSMASCIPTTVGWKTIAHHMTINMGKAEDGPAAHLLGQEVELKVVAVGMDILCTAVEVETEVPSSNGRKHITLAVNEGVGGKPKHSNFLQEWIPCDDMVRPLKGIVMVVE